MIRQTHDELVYYQFEALAERAVPHGVFTRLGGVSQGPHASLNVGHTVGDLDERADANQLRVYRALGVDPRHVVTAHQVHGHHVAQAGPQDGGRVIPNTDALISHVPGQPLLMRFADCMPILLHDRRTGAVGLAHAGWRGTMQDVAGEAVRAMERAYGTQPDELIAGMGAAIGACCYQVGQEVLEAAQQVFDDPSAFLRKQEDGSYHFDLAGANAWQLSRAGVGTIEIAPLCTACRVDEFFSHRAEKGKTGRFAVLLVHPDGRPEAKGGKESHGA